MSNEDITTDTLALYAMDLLDPAERAAVAEHLRVSADARAELGLVMGDLAAFAVTAEMHSPPALARQRMLKQVARERKSVFFNQPLRADKQDGRTAPTAFAGYAAQTSAYAAGQRGGEPAAPQRSIRRNPVEEEDRRSGFAVAMPYVGWALAASLAFAVFIQYNERTVAENNMHIAQNEMVRVEADSAQARAILQTLTDPSAQHVSLTIASTPPPPTGKATYMPDKGMLTFIASNMEPLQPYKVYELWLIPADGRDPIPAGTFKPDDRGNASVLLPELPKGVPAKMFAVTIEDDGGAQSPTMPMIISGA